MNGLELARGFFEEYGKPMLENDFADILPFLAAGFVGSGSEHYGYDDEVSRDHDFEPGFCIFLPDEGTVDRRRAFQLERAYAKLPKEYKGFRRSNMAPVGGNRNGVIRSEDFWKEKIGEPDGVLTTEQWLHIPQYALADAVNGEMYFDNFGEFTTIREALYQMPRDVFLKRLAGNLLIMAQSGQYNYTRCIRHGETEAAQLACVEFVKATMESLFLLSGKYMPYYKWSFRALRDIEGMVENADRLAGLLYGDNADSGIAEKKYYTIESIISDVIGMLMTRGITKATCGDLEKHAYSVNDMIEDSIVRNMNILVAV